MEEEVIMGFSTRHINVAECTYRYCHKDIGQAYNIVQGCQFSDSCLISDFFTSTPLKII